MYGRRDRFLLKIMASLDISNVPRFYTCVTCLQLTTRGLVPQLRIPTVLLFALYNYQLHASPAAAREPFAAELIILCKNLPLLRLPAHLMWTKRDFQQRKLWKLVGYVESTWPDPETWSDVEFELGDWAG